MRKLDPKKHPKLIAFLEKTAKILKTVAVICFSLVIVLCVFFYTKACADKNTAQLINASAEEASTVAETESGIDLTQYPSANLIQLLDKTATVNGNVVVSSSFDGKVTIKGTATQNGGRNSYFTDVIYLKAGTYSQFRLEEYEQLVVLTDVDTDKHFASYDTFTVAKDTRVRLGFSFTSGEDYDLEFYPMLNVGETLYPFTPNLNSVYNGGYNNGYEAGETDGYDTGKEDGLDLARAGYWNDCNVYVFLRGESNGISVSDYIEIAPMITSNGIDLSNVYTEINAKYPGFVCTDTTFGFEFLSSVYFDTIKMRCIGDSSVLSDSSLISVVYDPKTKRNINVNARFALIDGTDNVFGYQMQLTDEFSSDASFYGKQLKSIGTFSIQNISQFKTLRFYSSDIMANTNYQVGYQAGLNDNSAYDQGYDNGYTVGKSDGFQEGFNQTKSGGFGWLISSVEVFLDVKFFGDFGIGTLVYVGLGLMLVAIFLRVFSGA